MRQLEVLKQALTAMRDETRYMALAEIALGALQEVTDKLGAVTHENEALRHFVAKSKLPCSYCGLEDMGKCKLGFPGCARMDDLMLGDIDTPDSAAES